METRLTLHVRVFGREDCSNFKLTSPDGRFVILSNEPKKLTNFRAIQDTAFPSVITDTPVLLDNLQNTQTYSYQNRTWHIVRFLWTTKIVRDDGIVYSMNASTGFNVYNNIMTYKSNSYQPTLLCVVDLFQMKCVHTISGFTCSTARISSRELCIIDDNTKIHRVEMETGKITVRQINNYYYMSIPGYWRSPECRYVRFDLEPWRETLYSALEKTPTVLCDIILDYMSWSVTI